MQEHTKAELIVALAAGAMLLWLWKQNRDGGAGTGFTGLPQFLQPERRVPGAAPLFDIPAPVAGDIFNYFGTDGAGNPPNPTFGGISDLPQRAVMGITDGGGCNCAGSTNANSTFGGNSDLSAWLANQPNLMELGLAGLKGWY